MKKNVKFIGVAAAALLAVAPVATSVVPVNAADGQTATKKTTAPALDANNLPTGAAVYVVNSKNQVTTSATVNLTSNTVSNIVSQITKNYQLTSSSNNTSRGTIDSAYLTSQVKAALQGVGVTVNTDGSFNAPANQISINPSVLVYLNGGQLKTVHLNIIINSATVTADTSNNPMFTYNGKQYSSSQTVTLADNASFNYVPVNGSVNVAAIQNAFKAQVSKTDTNSLYVTVNTSKVNTAVAGTYPVTVSATNPQGNTTTLTFNLTVGAKNAKYQTATSSDGSAIPVYSINGNLVSKTTATVNSGSSLATFGTVTVNGVSYTRINSSTANQFVLTSVFNKATTDTNVTTSRVMIDSKAYDEKGNFTGNWYYYNTNIDYVPVVKTINGKTYYKVANKNEYVRVTNITGTKRVLRHNAYVYRTSYKRTPGVRKYYKGETVTTYGAAFTFRSGKKFYRITGCSPSNKMYIKKANF